MHKQLELLPFSQGRSIGVVHHGKLGNYSEDMLRILVLSCLRLSWLGCGRRSRLRDGRGQWSHQQNAGYKERFDSSQTTFRLSPELSTLTESTKSVLWHT